MKQTVRKITQAALEKLFQADGIAVSVDDLPKFDISRSKDVKFGDFASNVALVSGKELGIKPRDLAVRIMESMELKSSGISRCEIAGPGFINFFLSPDVWRNNLYLIHSRKEQ